LTGRHPIAVVNIAVDPTQIDVNVHPAKTEIRFLRERRVYAAVLRSVRQAVLEEAGIPGWGNENRLNKQIETNSVSTADTTLPDEFIELDLEETGDQIGDTPFIAPSNGDEPSTFPQDNPWLTVTEEETGTKPPSLSRLWQSHIRGIDPE